MVVMDGDILDIVCPRPASSSSACGDAVASPSACCECQAAIPPALPPAKKVSAADRFARSLQRPNVSDQLVLRSQRIEILKRARLAKALKKQERRAAPEAEDSLRCAQAWDSTQLHFGDQAARSAQEREVKHKLQFSQHGAMKLAYTDAMDKKLGSKSYVPVRAAVSSCFAEKQDEIVKHRLSNDCSDYLFAERSFDDTPAHLSFGMLSEFIAPIAKYVVPAKYRDIVGKSFADYKQILPLGIPAAQHGILDIFAERLVVEYGCGSLVEVLLPPRVMMGKKAGHIYRALQTSAGGSWSIEEFNMTHKRKRNTNNNAAATTTTSHP